MNGRVTIEDADSVKISGSITNESIEALGLKEGGQAVAIIKANSRLAAMRDAGIGARQASRITGLGKSTISRAYRDTPGGSVP